MKKKIPKSALDPELRKVLKQVFRAKARFEREQKLLEAELAKALAVIEKSLSAKLNLTELALAEIRGVAESAGVSIAQVCRAIVELETKALTLDSRN